MVVIRNERTGILSTVPNRKNKVLLLVEPEQRISPLKLVLEAETYNVLCADNMKNLRHLISRFPVNAVLIDSDAKPEQYDCKVVAKEVKESRPDVPVIMLSTRDWLSASDCDSADFHVAKGTSPVEIIRAIEKIMGDPQPEAKVSAGTEPTPQPSGRLS